MFLLLGRFSRGGRFVRSRDENRVVRLVGAGAGVYVSGLDINVGLFAQFGEIGARARLQLLRVNGVFDLLGNLLEGRNTRGAVGVDFQNNETLFGPDHIRVLAWLQGERLVFKLFDQFAALEIAQLSAVCGSGPVGTLLSHIFELGALLQLLQESVRLGFSLSHFGGIFQGRLRGGSLGILFVFHGGLGRLRRNHDFTQAHLFRSFQLFLVLVVPFLGILVADADFRTHFLSDHLFGDHAAADVFC